MDMSKQITTHKEFNLFNSYVKRTEKNVRRDLTQMYANREITREQFRNNYWHEVWVRISKSKKYSKYMKYTKIDG